MTVKELIELNQMITDCEITVRDNGFLVDQLNIGCAEGEKPPYPTRVPRNRKYAGAMDIRSENKFKDAAYILKSINAWDDGKDYWQVQWKRIPSAWLNLEVDSWEVWPSTRVCYSSPRRKRGNFNGQKIVITALYGGRTLEAPEEEKPKQSDEIDGQMSIEDWDYEVVEI